MDLSSHQYIIVENLKLYKIIRGNELLEKENVLQNKKEEEEGVR